MTDPETQYGDVAGGRIDAATISADEARGKIGWLQSIMEENPSTDRLADLAEEADEIIKEIEGEMKREQRNRGVLAQITNGVSLHSLTYDDYGDEDPTVRLVYDPPNGSYQIVSGTLTTAQRSPQKATVTDGDDDYSVYGTGWAGETGRVEKNGRKIGIYVISEVLDQ